MLLERQYITEIKEILTQARLKSYAAINIAMVESYWLIGKRIVEQEQNGEGRANYGEGLIKELSKALTTDFGKGFSVANLENFRKFYLTFPDFENPYAVRRDLTWTHYRLIMRIQNQKAREFYINECANQNWSSRHLERNINTFYYDRILSTKDDLKTLTKVSEQHQIEDFIKDPYIFEFLNLSEPNVKEKDIENALIDNLQKFLLELGKGFTFFGKQFRISSETSHFYVDLVFYNYLLKCFVLFDLKTTKLTHQDIGQMDMYRRMFDDLKKPEGDNPTIGIILCAEKSETVVKYSVLSDNSQLFAVKYMPFLPTEEELITEIERQKLLFNLG